MVSSVEYCKRAPEPFSQNSLALICNFVHIPNIAGNKQTKKYRTILSEIVNAVIVSK